MSRFLRLGLGVSLLGVWSCGSGGAPPGPIVPKGSVEVLGAALGGVSLRWQTNVGPISALVRYSPERVRTEDGEQFDRLFFRFPDLPSPPRRDESFVAAHSLVEGGSVLSGKVRGHWVVVSEDGTGILVEGAEQASGNAVAQFLQEQLDPGRPFLSGIWPVIGVRQKFEGEWWSLEHYCMNVQRLFTIWVEDGELELEFVVKLLEAQLYSDHVALRPLAPERAEDYTVRFGLGGEGAMPELASALAELQLVPGHPVRLRTEQRWIATAAASLVLIVEGPPRDSVALMRSGLDLGLSVGESPTRRTVGSAMYEQLTRRSQMLKDVLGLAGPWYPLSDEAFPVWGVPPDRS